MEDTEIFGVHLMIDGYDADPLLLADEEHLTQILNQLPQKLGMHPIAAPLVVEVGPKNRKDPGGLSGFVLIAESHVSFHTFPSRGFVTIDVYTCQADLDTARVTAALKQAFEISSIDCFVQKRGLRYPRTDTVRLSFAKVRGAANCTDGRA